MSAPRTTRDSQDPIGVVCQVTAGRFDREREQSCKSVVRGTTLGRVASSAALVSVALVGALSGTLPGHMRFNDGVQCRDVAACERRADVGPAVEAMLADQLATFGPACVDPKDFSGIPSRVLVRNARMTDFDTGVVRAVSFEQAWTGAKSGTVFVLRLCR